jgi:hypothetical protein
MDAAGYSGRFGQCWGFTTPSATGIEVVGGPVEDIALNIHCDDEAVADAFFRPGDLELLDHDPGLEIQIGETHLVRDDEGGWHPNDQRR